MKQFLLKARIKEVAAGRNDSIKKHIFAESKENALEMFKNELRNHDNLLDWEEIEFQSIEEVKK